MNNVYISIIIPVYNAENYLRECIDSVLEQRETYTDFEVILVDDGSTDSSLNICHEYEKKYDLTVISQENKGPAAARNNGLRRARGKYVLFIDSDDYIAKNSLREIVEDCRKQNEPDIVLLNGCKLYGDGRQVVIEKDYEHSALVDKNQNELFNYLSGRNKFNGSPCLKLVKKSTIEENGVYFEVGKRVEDLDWSMQCFLHAKSIGCHNGVYYYYRQDISTSNSSRFQDNSYVDFKTVIDKWIDYSNQDIYSNIKKYILKFACYEYIILLANCKDYIKQDHEWHKEKQFLFKYSDNKRAKAIKICIMLLGIKNTSILLDYYLRNR